MIHRASSEFWDDYDALPASIQRRADKQFELLLANPQHPSLHFKKLGMEGDHEIWSARVTQKYRALAIKQPEHYVWFWIGDHDTYDDNIS